MKHISLMTLFLFFLISCNQDNNSGNASKALIPPNQFVADIEKAHKANTYRNKEIVQFNIEVNYLGKKMLEGEFAMTTDMNNIRLNYGNKSVIWNGKTAYVTPAKDVHMMDRFHILTAPYFFSVPYKLSDPGTKWEVLDQSNFNGEPYKTARLTFDQGVGDTPDDWYILFSEPKSSQLHALAYIVSFFGGKEKAEQTPASLIYEKYINLSSGY